MSHSKPESYYDFCLRNVDKDKNQFRLNELLFNSITKGDLSSFVSYFLPSESAFVSSEGFVLSFAEKNNAYFYGFLSRDFLPEEALKRITGYIRWYYPLISSAHKKMVLFFKALDEKYETTVFTDNYSARYDVGQSEHKLGVQFGVQFPCWENRIFSNKKFVCSQRLDLGIDQSKFLGIFPSIPQSEVSYDVEHIHANQQYVIYNSLYGISYSPEERMYRFPPMIEKELKTFPWGEFSSQEELERRLESIPYLDDVLSHLAKSVPAG